MRFIMSALTRLVSHTFADISQKRQSKRLVHDESDFDAPSVRTFDNVPTVPNFNTFDPAEHFGAGIWQSTSSSQTSPTSTTETESSTESRQPTPSPVPSDPSSEKNEKTKRSLPIKNMVRKLTPFNNNNKESKNRNPTVEKEKDSKKKKEEKEKEKDKEKESKEAEADREAKAQKKSVWNFKETIERRKCGDRQMLIDLD